MFNNKRNLNKQDIVSLLKLTDKVLIDDLYSNALKLKKENFNENIVKTALIEFSNYCNLNCLYCISRKSNNLIERYRLEVSKVLILAEKAKADGYDQLILESGADVNFTSELKIEMLSKIKEKIKIPITLGIGEKTEDEYYSLKKAGAERFILTHKTSDPILYRQLHPEMKYSERIKCINNLKQLGYKVGSGIMAGLPGQTFESIANDILLFKEMSLDMISIIPYIPYQNTPLYKIFKQSGGYFAPAVGYFDVNELMYKIIAISRLINPNTSIQILNKIENYEFDSEFALNCGANEVIYNFS